MLQLLQPIWLFMTAGIVIPVFIHLWQRRPGKILKIGSVQLITADSLRHARSRRISDWWLLLLRCLLVLLLALLLSEPVWKKTLNARNTRGWVLLEPDVYPAFRVQVDSLLQAGYELHAFDTTFRKADLGTLPAAGSLPYWMLLRNLPQRVPAGVPVYLFTSNRLQRLQYFRPSLSLDLHWYAAVTTDSVSNWNACTYRTTNDSFRIIGGHSTPEGTSFHYHDTMMLADTAVLHCTIYTDKYPEDAYYLRAALQAVQQYTGRKMVLTYVRGTGQLPAQQDWLWWLSEQPLPSHVSAARKVIYASGKPVEGNTVISGTDIVIYRRIPAADTSGAIWKDAFGNTLLSDTLYTHLHPAWTALVWDGRFPQLLLELLFPAAKTYREDRRMADPQQLQPRLAAGASVRVVQETHPLQQICWVLLLLVFCLERFFSFKQTQATIYE
ncbi:MAG TPA: BatA domain-containing protein [Chitinophaga sp.]|uniref:BatA domain-containing protein n=1 Tax=Chitinophaga sp. TaxID=1869181 RepID=UPI002BC957C4|nr:BatA domain-containing protein [Chitinophaga sp.]HVI44736.1 BatA domain-containing protein [Chitinophaga sp.]